MKNIVLLYFLITFAGCRSSIQEGKTSSNDSSYTDNSPDENSDIEELEMQSHQKREAFKNRMLQKDFFFLNYEPCDIGIGIEDIKKHGKQKIFDVEKTVQQDSLVLKFRFITDCCLEHVADVKQSNDTLFLSYQNIATVACDCYCFYNYKYQLPLNKYTARHLVLGDSVLDIPTRP